MLLSKKFAVASVFAALVVPSVASAGGSMFEVVPGALNPQLCGGTGCWTNHLRVTDIDGDGDLDAIFVNYGDFFGGGASPEPLAVYENDGSGTFANVSASAVAGLETNAHQICIGDVDGDGDGDIYVPDGTGTVHRLMINDGAGVYVDEADGRLPAAVPSSGACRFGDLDGDGDLDLVVSDGYGNGMAALLLYENDGMGVFTEVPGAFSGAIAGQEIDDIEIFDADRDFDLDVFANAHEGGFGGYYLNDGTGALEGQSFPPPQAGGTGYHYNSALCDVDGDGDLDMWIDNIGGGFTEQLLINGGAGVFSDATAAQVTGNPGADDNGIACVDIDNDGDFDAVVLSLQTEERLLQNDGSGNFALVAGAFPGGVDSTLWGEFGDLNGDARLDLVTGQGEFNDQTNKVYFGSNAQPVDDRAPTVIAVQEGAWQAGDDPVVRFAVSDRTMSDEGPRLAMAYVVVVSPGSREELTARFVGGDVFRVELPTVPEDGYQFQACAEDRAGNVGCSESIDVSGGGADTGGAGSGDTAGDGDTMAPDGDGSDNVPGDGSGEGPGSGLDGDSSGSAATDGTGDGGSSDDDGSCSCRTQSPTTPLLWMLLGLPLVWRRSRSRA